MIQRRGMERGRKSTVKGWMVEPNLSWAKFVESGGSTDYQRMFRRSQARVKMAAAADHFVTHLRAPAACAHGVGVGAVVK